MKKVLKRFEKTTLICAKGHITCTRRASKRNDFWIEHQECYEIIYGPEGGLSIPEHVCGRWGVPNPYTCQTCGRTLRHT